MQFAARVDDGVVKAGVGLRLLQTAGIRFQVGELQRVGRNDVAVLGLVLSVVKEVAEPGASVNAEMTLALGADVQVLVEVFLPDDLAALVTLDPEAFCLDAFLPRSVEVAVFPLKPCHKINASV